REELWVSGAGLIVAAVLLFLGGFLAWYSWTQIARPRVFHVPAYNPPPGAILIATCAIGVLIFLALAPYRDVLSRPSTPLSAPPRPPPRCAVGPGGGSGGVLLFGPAPVRGPGRPGLCPGGGVGGGALPAARVLLSLARSSADPRWHGGHEFGLTFGPILG